MEEKTTASAVPRKKSQRKLADQLVLQGLDVAKNVIQRIEAGQRFVTDIELKTIARFLNTIYNELLESAIHNNCVV